MPTCRRKRVVLTEPSEALLHAAKSDPSREVYYLQQTGEIFETYEYVTCLLNARTFPLINASRPAERMRLVCPSTASDNFSARSPERAVWTIFKPSKANDKRQERCTPDFRNLSNPRFSRRFNGVRLSFADVSHSSNYVANIQLSFRGHGPPRPSRRSCV